ncbi:MAG: ribonuclease E/G [Lachnospiraceae bacterium]|nr:ribonuclease E/G [Lachnospiraceae bacterium]
MKKHAVVSKIEDKVLAFSFENDELAEITSYTPADEDEVRLNGIYTVRVANIVDNINGAFLSYNQTTLYYDLDDNERGIFLNRKNDNHPHSGDIMLVQVKRDALKSKNAACSSELSIYGENLVLTYQLAGIGVSKKLSSKDRDRIKEYFNGFDYSMDELSSIELKPYGYVVRTSGAKASKEELIIEAYNLKAILFNILKRAETSKANVCLYDFKGDGAALINDIANADEGYIITDRKKCYDCLSHTNSLRTRQADIRFYDDDTISLAALYDLKKHIDSASKKNVWLKNGGYLVIEHTEALNVIDVNTGKSMKDKHSKERHVFETNILAAYEVARQLRIRNYSGIIIVDFIDMDDEEHKEKLMSTLKKELIKDPVHARLVDITELGLVEITRKKIKKPLYEFLGD